MESPILPLSKRTQAVCYSILLILWWVGIWGIADTVIHLVFKGQTMKELGVYIGLVLIVLFAVYINPDIVDRM